MTDSFNRRIFRSALTCGLCGLILLSVSSAAFGQVSNDSKSTHDPTSESEIIKQTMSKIKDVEKLDKHVEENKALKKANSELKKEVASIKKQLEKLSKQFADQASKIRKQLLQVPSFEVKSKIIGGGNDMAILKSKDRHIRIRVNTEMSIPVSEGVWVLMQVRKISKEMIELHFPELERTVYLYD